VTGYHVRILRDGKWQNLELDQLTDAELDAFFEGVLAPAPFAIALARWIRDNVKEGAPDAAARPEK
jgi:hypothetical protein